MNIYPKPYLLYPGKSALMIFCLSDFIVSIHVSAAVLVGLAAAPLWTSKCSYLTETGTVYADSELLSRNVIVNRFFGIFFMFFQSGSPIETLSDKLFILKIVQQVNSAVI